jgi:L-ascorbate metabolism protein UlaG (beta-lactamase superfamily)
VKRILAALTVSWALLGAAPPVGAQETLGPAIPCGLGMVENDTPLLHRAAVRPTQAEAAKVKVTFVGHATFLLETPDGVSLATDYNGHNLPRKTPDVVTMNRFHITHYTDFPDPDIKHVLRGWDPKGGIVRNHMKLKDLRVYSVPSNIQYHGVGVTHDNSIFVFESAGLCIAHLSHLHHNLDAEEASKLGRIDVLIVPVDGFVTMSHAEVMNIIGVIKPRLVLPCHWDLFGGPFAFHAKIQGVYPTKTTNANVIELSQDSLPRDTEVLFLRQGP